MHHSSLCELDVGGSHARQLVILVKADRATEETDETENSGVVMRARQKNDLISDEKLGLRLSN